jgi:hypothetical protein
MSLATATSAVSQAMAMLDQQLAAVGSTNVAPDFPGAAPMVSALGQMKQAAGQWPAVKAALLAAAQSTVDAGPAASLLGVSDAGDATAMAADVAGFVTSTLQPLQSHYQTATSGFDTFAGNLANVESAAGVANTDAVKALDAAQADIQSRIEHINAKIKDLKSAGSIIVGILSGGISVAVELEKLQGEIASLNSAERAETLQQQAYSMAYSQFTNACSAEAVAVKAIATVNTALQQAVNTLNDVSTGSSSNLTVMQAELSAFREDFAGAVTASRSMLN